MKRPGIYFCWALPKMLTRTETGSEGSKVGTGGSSTLV